MRILKFISVFLGTLIVVAAIIIIPAWHSIKTIFSKSSPLKQGIEWVNKTGTERGFVNYLKANPDNGSFYSATLNQPDSTIAYQDSVMRPMGELSDFLLLIEYAREVDNGTLSPEDTLSLSEIDPYLLPDNNVGDHEEALNFLKETGRIGKNNTIHLKDVPIMITGYNDEAASDYLYMRLGESHLKDLLNVLDSTEIELPLPWSGLALAKALPADESDSLRIARLLEMPKAAFRHLIISKTDSLKSIPYYRMEMKKKMSAENTDIPFQVMNLSNRLLPKASTAALGKLMNEAMHDSLINKNVSRLVKNTLQWKIHNPAFDSRFSYYGGLFDQRVGMLSGMDASVSGDTGISQIHVVLVENVPLALWLHLSSEFMDQNFLERMTLDQPFHAFTFNKLMMGD